MSSLFRRGPASDDGKGILARLAQSPIVARGREAAAECAVVVKELLQSTGKAAEGGAVVVKAAAEGGAVVVKELLRSTGKAAEGGAVVVKKLLRSTGKAAWIAGTTFLVLYVPLVIQMDREQQLNDLELQQASILGFDGSG